MYWKTIVLTALHTGYEEYENFLPVFKRYYYLNWIAGNTLSKIKQTSFNILKWLKDKRPLIDIKNDLEKLLTDSNNHTIDRAIDSLAGDIYFEPWCKPLLFMIEYNQQDNPPFYAMWDRNIHVEHILPRGYRKKEEWNFIVDHDDLEDWINSGANLTLLSGVKNISASNEGFELKMIAYDGTGNHEKKDTKISSFKITQKIVNDYNSSKFGKQWYIVGIEDRWRWFCSETEKVLGIDLGELKSQTIKEISLEQSDN